MNKTKQNKRLSNKMENEKVVNAKAPPFQFPLISYKLAPGLVFHKKNAINIL